MARLASLVGTALLASTLGGCMTISDGKLLRQDLDAQSARLKKVEEAQNAQLEQLKQAEAKAQESMQQLQEMIEKATGVVQRNSADVTVQVADLQTQLASSEGKIAELQYAIDEIKKAQAAAPAPPPASGNSANPSSATAAPAADAIPADKNELYATAYRAYSDRDFAKARTLFRAYIDRYKNDAQADNAQYWIGASYLIENRPATALGELRKVIENFRGGDAVDESLLDMSEAFYRLKACSDAKTTLDTLIKTQPNSPLVEKAKEKLKAIKKLDRNYCTS